MEEDIAQAILFRLSEAGLVNDGEFAKAWVQSRHNHKKISKRVMASELRQKGVQQSDIDLALEEIDENDEYRSAFDLAFKKFNTISRLEPEVQVRRIQSLLARKGFSFGVISQVLKELELVKI